MTKPDPAELSVVYRDVESLAPYENNARTHPEAQLAAIRESMLTFGWTQPVLIDDEGIIAGHGRIEAAKALWAQGKAIARCPKGRVPTIHLPDLTEDERRALVIADNQLALGAEWNLDVLSGELKLLSEAGFDMAPMGFEPGELDRLLSRGEENGGLTDPDEVPDPIGEPVSRPGDVWRLGKHRLVCGDSTSADAVAKALNGVEPHLMVTDPPYGVEYDADWRNKALRAGGSTDGGRAVGKVKNDDNADWAEAWALFPGDVAYVWHAGNKAHIVATNLEACGFNIRAQIIWAKNNIVIGRGDYHPKHEPCWYAVRKNKKGHYCGGRKQTTVWNIDKPMKSETGHSTQKPVECMKRPIENNSSPGQAVYEPFSGSGTTIIACEQTGRVCHAIELNPAYVDMAILRWQNFTGQNATLEGDNRNYTEMMAERAPDNVLRPADAPEGTPAPKRRKKA